MSSILSAVFCIRNRDHIRLRNCFRTLRNQADFNEEFEIILVNYGSDSIYSEQYAAVCNEFEAKLINVGTTPHFSRSHSLNIGIRSSNPESQFILPSDVDMLYAPNFLKVLWDELRQDRRKMVACGHFALKQDAVNADTDVVQDFTQLCKPEFHECFRTWPGPCEAASRSWFFKVRGFDERFVRYGSEDGDILRRAARSGLRIVWIHDRTTMLHQWHTTQWAEASEKGEFDEQILRFHFNQAYYISDKAIARNNPETWGTHQSEKSPESKTR